MLRGYIRVHVEIDITKPLALVVYITRSEGNKSRAAYTYEKLQNVYQGCGIVGHEQRLCTNPTLYAAVKMQNGPWAHGFCMPAYRSRVGQTFGHFMRKLK